MGSTNIEFKEIFKKKVELCLDPKKDNQGKQNLKDLIDAYESEIVYINANYSELVRVAKKMRSLQVEYFKNRSKEVMKLSIQYEQLCDKILFLINDQK